MFIFSLVLAFLHLFLFFLKPFEGLLQRFLGFWMLISFIWQRIRQMITDTTILTTQLLQTTSHTATAPIPTIRRCINNLNCHLSTFVVSLMSLICIFIITFNAKQILPDLPINLLANTHRALHLIYFINMSCIF